MPPTGTYSRAALATRRLRSAPRAAWFGARARNVMQRPRRLIGAGVGIFVGILLIYLLLPAGARGVRTLVFRDQTERRDTTELVAREAEAVSRLTEADRALARVRQTNAALVASLGPRAMTLEESLARDSVGASAAALRALLQRAESAPLPESYRALARSPLLVDDRLVAALVDTLTEIERERDELGGGATVDPVFVALTTQANEVGRRIAAVAERRVDALDRQVVALESGGKPTSADSASLGLADSSAVLAARESAWVAYQAARRTLAQARADNEGAAAAAERERARAQLAPIPVLVAGAIVLAAAFAFAIWLIDEMRSPRVADAAEAERLTDLRVLGVARQRTVPPDRSRRAADRTIPPALDPTFDAYRVVAWHLSSMWPKDGIVTVTGDNPLIAATVAANLAAVLANDARVTLLIDADLEREPVRTVLGLPGSPGLAAVLQNRRKWSETLLGVPVGRGRTLDVLPAGGRESPMGPAESQALLAEIQRAARRHDATIVVAPLAWAKRFRAGDDVVVCATQTTTRLATLARTVASMIDVGARVRGVVLWEGVVPVPARTAAPGDGAAA
jgi:Mrp family chromosome partitioning ATPase